MLDEIDANIEIKRGEEKLLEVKKYLFFKDKEEEIINLEKKTLEPNFWDNRKTAEKILKKLKILKDKIENFEKLEKELEDLKQYIIMLKETSDDDIMKKEILEEISKKIFLETTQLMDKSLKKFMKENDVTKIPEYAKTSMDMASIFGLKQGGDKIDYGSFFSTDDKVLCFDDLERANVDVIDILRIYKQVCRT